jgi:RNA-directed DNA polymerase
MGCTTRAHLLDVDGRRGAAPRTGNEAAPGRDGVTAAADADPREAPLTDLYERRRRGRDPAPPVKRTGRDKADGSPRPRGRPAFEDNIVQRAGTRRLGAVYEHDGHDVSDGLRAGHRPLQALPAVRAQGLERTIGWSVDADGSGGCDRGDHDRLRDVRRKRVKDGGRWRLLGPGRHAGVLDGEHGTDPAPGTPQGGVRTLPTKLTCPFHDFGQSSCSLHTEVP